MAQSALKPNALDTKTKELIALAKDDPRISFVVLKLDALWGAGLPQLEELASELREFRASGKIVSPRDVTRGLPW